jgi:phospholipid/cholesterol/gamma-HCH transport system permease protein
VVGFLGQTGLNLVLLFGGMGLLLREVAYWTFVGSIRGYRHNIKPYKIRFGESFNQMVRFGVRAIPIVVLIQTFVGMIIALQLAVVLDLFNVTSLVGGVVGATFLRELAPLLTGVILSGFAGASIAAELGTMVDSEEILALETSALHPVHFLVAPRMLAVIVMSMALSVLSNYLGILGGLIIAVGPLKLGFNEYMNNVLEFSELKDLLTGTFKAGVFGMLISLIGCYQGLRVSGGSEGVGRATTNAVVHSLVFIIASDCFFTALFYFVLE